MARHSIASLVFCIGAYLKSTRCYALIIGVSFVFPAQAIHVYLGHAPGRLSRLKSEIRSVVDRPSHPRRCAAPETLLFAVPLGWLSQPRSSWLRSPFQAESIQPTSYSQIQCLMERCQRQAASQLTPRSGQRPATWTTTSSQSRTQKQHGQRLDDGLPGERAGTMF